MTYAPTRRQFCLALGALALPGIGRAQSNWPDKPIQIISPAPPGGSSDRMARMLGMGLAKELKQSAIVENKPGAGSTIGTGFVAHANPDGCTLILSGVFDAINPSLYSGLNYDYERDFVHLAPVFNGSNVLVVRPDFPISNLKELAAAAKAKPGYYTFASAGSGTSGHLTMEIFKRAAGVNMTHVPYRGSAPAIQDVMSGQVSMIATNQDAVLPLVRAGKFKALAITTSQRVPVFADTPTFVESGYPDMVITSWTILDAPKGTPDAVVKRLRETAAKVMKDPAMRKPFEDEGNQVFDLPVDQLGAFVKKETDRWASVIHAAGIKIE